MCVGSRYTFTIKCHILPFLSVTSSHDLALVLHPQEIPSLIPGCGMRFDALAWLDNGAHSSASWRKWAAMTNKCPTVSASGSIKRSVVILSKHKDPYLFVYFLSVSANLLNNRILSSHIFSHLPPIVPIQSSNPVCSKHSRIYLESLRDLDLWALQSKWFTNTFPCNTVKWGK